MNIDRSQMYHSTYCDGRMSLALMIAMLTLGFVTVLVNLGVILRVIKIVRQGHDKPAFFFIGNLALSDFAVGLYVVTAFLLHITNKSDLWQQKTCMLQIGVAVTACQETIFTIVLISVDKYLYICHGLHYSRMVTRKRVYGALVLSWCLAILIGSLPAMGLHVEWEEACNRCTFAQVISTSFAIIFFITSVAFPLAVVVALYSILLVLAVKMHKARYGGSYSGRESSRSSNFRLSFMSKKSNVSLRTVDTSFSSSSSSSSSSKTSRRRTRRMEMQAYKEELRRRDGVDGVIGGVGGVAKSSPLAKISESAELIDRSEHSGGSGGGGVESRGGDTGGVQLSSPPPPPLSPHPTPEHNGISPENPRSPSQDTIEEDARTPTHVLEPPHTTEEEEEEEEEKEEEERKREEEEDEAHITKQNRNNKKTNKRNEKEEEEEEEEEGRRRGGEGGGGGGASQRKKEEEDDATSTDEEEEEEEEGGTEEDQRKKKGKKKKKKEEGGGGRWGSSLPSKYMNRVMTETRDKMLFLKKCRAVKTVLLILVSFSATYVPFVVGSLVYSAQKEKRPCLLHLLNTLLYCAVVANSLANPLIYAYGYSQFRVKTKRFKGVFAREKKRPYT